MLSYYVPLSSLTLLLSWLLQVQAKKQQRAKEEEELQLELQSHSDNTTNTININNLISSDVLLNATAKDADIIF